MARDQQQPGGRKGAGEQVGGGDEPRKVPAGVTWHGEGPHADDQRRQQEADSAPQRDAEPTRRGSESGPGGGTNSFVQRQQDASSSGLEPGQAGAGVEPHGEPGGLAQQDGGALREEDADRGKSGSIR